MKNFKKLERKGPKNPKVSGTGDNMYMNGYKKHSNPTENSDPIDNDEDGNDNPLAGVLDDSVPSGSQGSDEKMQASSHHDVEESEAKKNLSNIEISVKNVDNLDEFSLATYIEPEYIPKLQKWIEKNKFQCEETIDDVKLKV